MGQGGAVAQKTSEISLRIAIGADTPDVFRLVFSQGGKLIFAGLGIGLALALILDQLSCFLLVRHTRQRSDDDVRL